MEKNEVNEAFEILLEEIEAVSNTLSDIGASSFKSGDYDKARLAIEQATRLQEFREKVKSLQNEWKSLFKESLRRRKKKKRTSKLKRGLRTSEDTFRMPILQSLIELGGSAPVSDILNLVEKKLKGTLTKHDYQPLPSDPKSIRWRNTAMWCRKTLVNEGLLKSDAPFGIWEITDKGKKLVNQG